MPWGVAEKDKALLDLVDLAAHVRDISLHLLLRDPTIQQQSPENPLRLSWRHPFHAHLVTVILTLFQVSLIRSRVAADHHRRGSRTQRTLANALHRRSDGHHCVIRRVQAVLMKRRTTAERPQRLTFAFTGLVRCAACGRRLVGYEKRKKDRSYRHYACSNHLRGLYAQPQLTEQAIHAAVLATMAQLTITQTDHDLCARCSLRRGATTGRNGGGAPARAEGELVALNNQRARLVDLVVDGTLARDDYDRKQREKSRPNSPWRPESSKVRMTG